MALRALKGVRQLRFLLCQSSQHSENLRKYLAHNYEAIRQSSTRITVRQCQSSPPTAVATFSYGVERTVDLRKMNAAQIDQAINSLEVYSEQVSKTLSL